MRGKSEYFLGVAVLLGILTLYGCQTTGLTPSAEGGANSVSSATDASQRVSRDFYLFSDESDHLQELLAANNLADAERLFVEQEATLAAKPAKSAPLLASLAQRLNETKAAPLAPAHQRLAALGWPTPAAGWPEQRAALTEARKALADYQQSPLLKKPAYRSPLLENLSTALAEREARIKADAPAQLAAFDHFGSGGFFAAYPIELDAKNLIAAQWDRMRAGLANADLDRLNRFLANYPAKEHFDEPRQAELAGLFAQTWAKSNAGRGGPGLADQLGGLRAAEKAGLKPKVASGLKIGFIEVTSRTLLDRQQIQFPAQIAVDLPLQVVKAELDEALSDPALGGNDYLMIIDVAYAKAARRAFQAERKLSRMAVATERVPNPAWEEANREYQLAVNEFNMARMGGGGYYSNPGAALGDSIGRLISAAIAKGKLDESAEKLKNIPRIIEVPIYRDYHYQLTTMAAVKTMTVHYYVIDRANRRYFKSTFDVQEDQRFVVPYALQDTDPDKKKIEEANRTDKDIEEWEKLPSSVKLSALVDHYVANGGQAQPLPALAKLREEMLKDRNVALTRYKEETFTGSTRYDPRFDSVVVVHNPRGSLGSGFFVRPDIVMTNHHVIEGATFVEMTMYNRQETFGKVIGYDVRLDLALVQVQTRGKPVKFYERRELELGSTVDVIGHPAGLNFSITRGVVSAVRKEKSVQLQGGQDVLFVQIDAPTNPGNSGGPVFKGEEVVGVVSWGLEKKNNVSVHNLNFNVHYSEALKFIKEQLKE